MSIQEKYFRIFLALVCLVTASACEISGGGSVKKGEVTEDQILLLEVTEHDANIAAGDYANVVVQYSGVDTDKFTVYVEIKNEERVVSQLKKDVATSTGVLNLRMPIDWNAPAKDDYFVSVAAVSKLNGWDEPSTVIVENRDQLIRLAVPVPPPSVSLSQIPQAVRAGEALQVQVDYRDVTFSSHDLVVYLAKGNSRISSAVVSPADSSRATVSLQLPWVLAPSVGYILSWEVVSRANGPGDPRYAYGEYTQAPIEVKAPIVAAPQVNFITAENSVVVGNYAKARIRFYNIPTAETHDFLIYVVDAAGHSVVTPIDQRGDGESEIALPINLNAASGNYKWSWAVISKSDGWNGSLSAYLEDGNKPLQIKSAATALPIVTLSASLSSVAIGDYYNVGVTYQAVDFSIYDLVVYLSDAHEFYESYVITSDNGGSAQVKLPIRANTNPGAVRAGWSLTPKNGTASDPRALSGELPNTIILAVPSLQLPTLAIKSYAQQISSGEYANVGIDYANVDFNRYYLSLAIRNNDRTAGVVEITQGALSNTLVQKIPVWWDVAPGDGFYVELTAVDRMRDGWSDPSTVQITNSTPAIKIIASPSPPQISIANFARTIMAGEYLPIEITHSGVDFSTHDLFVYLHDVSVVPTPSVEVKVPAASSLSSNVKLPIAWTSAGKKYEVEWYLAPKPTTSDLRSMSHRYSDQPIDVSVPTLLPPTLEIQNYGSAVKPGETISVVVKYSGIDFSTHTLGIDISDGVHVVGRATYSISDNLNSAGTINALIPIDSNASSGSGYFVEFYALDVVRDGWLDPKTVLLTAKSPLITIAP